MKKKIVCTKYEAAQLFSTMIIIGNVFEQQIMFSEGSCDSEDWSNDAKKSVMHYKNKLYFEMD